jgi:hypothetical protein
VRLAGVHLTARVHQTARVHLTAQCQGQAAQGGQPQPDAGDHRAVAAGIAPPWSLAMAATVPAARPGTGVNSAGSAPGQPWFGQVRPYNRGRARRAEGGTSGEMATLPSPETVGGDAAPMPPHASRRAQVRRLIQAVRDSDEVAVQDAVMRLSRSRPLFAPVALGVGALVMLFAGVKLLFANWRLTLVQLLPAMWIWLAMLDLKVHVLHGKSLPVLRGPVTIPLVLAVAAVTAASFFLNAVFGFAISQPGSPQIRPAFHRARSRLPVILAWGMAVGICLGVSTIIVIRWGLWWFAISLSIVIAVMMVAYVAVPARLIGISTTRSRRDKLTASVVGGTLGAVVCAPGYLLGRVGLLMLGSSALFIPGIAVFAAGLTLQAGTTSTVKTVQMSAKLAAGHRDAAGERPPPREPAGG